MDIRIRKFWLIKQSVYLLGSLKKEVGWYIGKEKYTTLADWLLLLFVGMCWEIGVTGRATYINTTISNSRIHSVALTQQAWYIVPHPISQKGRTEKDAC